MKTERFSSDSTGDVYEELNI